MPPSLAMPTASALDALFDDFVLDAMAIANVQAADADVSIGTPRSRAAALLEKPKRPPLGGPARSRKLAPLRGAVRSVVAAKRVGVARPTRPAPAPPPPRGKSLPGKEETKEA